MSIKVIGIDPGLNHTGWGIISFDNNILKFIDCGVITTNSKEHIGQRLSKISSSLINVINNHKPEFSSIEKVFVNSNPNSSLMLGQARGVAMLALTNANLEIFEYSPNLVKKTVVGSGHADKTQVKAMVQLLLPKANIKKADEADALAIAITMAQHHNFNQKITNA